MDDEREITWRQDDVTRAIEANDEQKLALALAQSPVSVGPVLARGAVLAVSNSATTNVSYLAVAALCHASIEIFRSLVDAGCPLSDATAPDLPPVWLCACQGLLEQTSYLIVCGADPNGRPPYKPSILEICVRNGWPKLVNDIISSNLPAPEIIGDALLAALETNQFEFFDAIVSQKRIRDALFACDQACFMVTQLAARGGYRPEAVEKLLAIGMPFSQHALMWYANCPEKTQLLLAHGAFLGVPRLETGGLLNAYATSGNPETLAMLLGAGLDPLVISEEWGSRSPFDCAAASPHPENLAALLAQTESRAIERQPFLQRALWAAVRENRVDAVRMLLRAGCSPTMKDSDGKSAFDHLEYRWASVSASDCPSDDLCIDYFGYIGQKDEEIVYALLDADPDPSARAALMIDYPFDVIGWLYVLLARGNIQELLDDYEEKESQGHVALYCRIVERASEEELRHFNPSNSAIQAARRARLAQLRVNRELGDAP